MQRLIDLVNDLLIDLSAKRGRALLILIAIMLSTGALVASMGISETAAKQINADLAATSTDRLSIDTVPSLLGDNAEASEIPPAFFLVDAEERLTQIRTVKAAGIWIPMPDAQLRRGSNESVVSSPDSSTFNTIGATSSYLEAVGAVVPHSWMLDHGDEFPIAFLGSSVAEALEVPLNLLDYTGYRVHINNESFEVIGVLPIADRASLENNVVLPYQTVLDGAKSGDLEAQMFIYTEPGAGAPVAEIVEQVLRPDAPEVLKVSPVANLDSLRTGVSSQLSRLAAAIGAILLALTALLIANSMVVSVVARTAEIGLRRALGASRGAIASLFLADGALVGFLGGIAGAAFGTSAVVVVAWHSDWTASLNLVYLIAGPILGLVIGTISSAYPAWQAARISPADAVRSE